MSCCRRTAIAPVSFRCCDAAVAPLSCCCRTAIAPLLFRCCSAAVARLSRCCRTTIAPVSLHCRSAAIAPAVNTQSHRYHTGIAPLSLRYCRSVVALLSHRYCTGIAPLSLRCCRSFCCYSVTPLSHWYCSTVAPLLLLLLLLRSPPVSNRCRAVVKPLLLRPREGKKKFNIELILLYCHSTVASAVNRKVHTVVA